MAGLATLGHRLRPHPSRLKFPEKKAEPFYLSKEWRDLMAKLRAERGDHCEYCGAANVRTLGDHIVEIKDGGALLDPSNVRLMCFPCHGKKTAREAAKRLARKHG